MIEHILLITKRIFIVSLQTHTDLHTKKGRGIPAFAVSVIHDERTRRFTAQLAGAGNIAIVYHTFFLLLPSALLAIHSPNSNPEEIAPVPQTDRHFPQRMHSGPLISFVTATFIGQICSHRPQFTHLLRSRLI